MDAPVMYARTRLTRNMAGRLSVDCYVPLDTTQSVDQNLINALHHLVPENQHPKSRHLGHLNNIVVLLRKNEESQIPVKMLLNSLKLLLTGDKKEIRTASLRCLRYALKCKEDLAVFYENGIEHFVVKCLDVNMENETERVQALRLIRHLISLDPSRCPQSVVYCLVALCNNTDDNLHCSALETLCEYAILSPAEFTGYDIVSLLLQCAMDIEKPEPICEAILGVVLHLLSKIQTGSAIDLEYVISPLMEIYLKLPTVKPGIEEEKITNRLKRCQLGLKTILSSWTGVGRLCTPSPCGIRSLIYLLCIANPQMQRFIMDVLFEQLLAKTIEYYDEEFERTVTNFLEVDTANWSLQQDFVVGEGAKLLRKRPTFIEQHRSVLLTCLLHTELCEALAEVAMSTKSADVAVQATVLLAEVLELCESIIPAMYESVSLAVSCLLSNSAASEDFAIKSKSRQTVNRLVEYSLIKSRFSETNVSLFLQAIVHQTGSDKLFVPQPRELLEPVEPVLRDLMSISQQDQRTWDWDIITMVLESAYDLPKSGEDEGHYRFIRRLIHFFKPSSRFYSIIRLEEDYAHSLTILVCQLVAFIVESNNDEAGSILMELLMDIGRCLQEVCVDIVTGDPILGPNRLRTCLSQHYFLIIGHLTHYDEGEKFLEKCNLVEVLMNLIGVSGHPEYSKLTISSLNYGNHSVGKVLLCKALTGACVDARVYSCKFLAFLMQLKLPGVVEWGMNLLVTELLDQNVSVSDSALLALESLCDDKHLLENLVFTMPPLMHFSDKGKFLLARLMSIPSGYKIYKEAGVLNTELRHWRDTFNAEYVRLDEEHRNKAFNPSSSANLRSYPLPHLYGQLAQHQSGFEYLSQADYTYMHEDFTSSYIQCLKTASHAKSPAEIFALKTALWVLGHLGSSSWGAEWLEDEGLLSMIITLSTSAANLSVRTIAFHAVNLVARTEQGTSLIEKYDWVSLLHQGINGMSTQHSLSFSSGSGSFINNFMDSFRRPMRSVTSCPEVSRHKDRPITRDNRTRGQSDPVVHNSLKLTNFQRSATVSAGANSDDKLQGNTSPAHLNVVPGIRRTASSDSPSGVVLSITDDCPDQRRPRAGSKTTERIGRGFCVPNPVWALFEVNPIVKKEPVPTTSEVGESLEELTDELNDICKRVLQMCGRRSQKSTETELLKQKQTTPELFQDETLYTAICAMFSEHYFGPTARRFIQELFLDVEFNQMFSEVRTMFENVSQEFSQA